MDEGWMEDGWRMDGGWMKDGWKEKSVYGEVEYFDEK